jgi:hypothetical protein
VSKDDKLEDFANGLVDRVAGWVGIGCILGQDSDATVGMPFLSAAMAVGMEGSQGSICFLGR